MLRCPCKAMGEGHYFSWFCSFYSFLEEKGFSLWEKWFPDVWADGSHVLTLPKTGSFSVWFLDQQPWCPCEPAGNSTSGALCWPAGSDSLGMGLKKMCHSQFSRWHPDTFCSVLHHPGWMASLPAGFVDYRGLLLSLRRRSENQNRPVK